MRFMLQYTSNHTETPFREPDMKYNIINNCTLGLLSLGVILLAPQSAEAYTIIVKRDAFPPVDQAIERANKQEHQIRSANTQSLSSQYEIRSQYFEGTNEETPVFPTGITTPPIASVPNTEDMIWQETTVDLPPPPSELMESYEPKDLSEMPELSNTGFGVIGIAGAAASVTAAIRRKSLISLLKAKKS